jgi:hypothetical protein
MHAALGILLPACAALCDWQVHRALSGNELSWAYVFEWPFFGAYGTYLWWKLVHDQPCTSATRAQKADPPAAKTQDDEHHDEDEELAAYNRYLAELQAGGRPKRW